MRLGRRGVAAQRNLAPFSVFHAAIAAVNLHRRADAGEHQIRALDAFASRRSASASACFAARIQAHLARCGVELRLLAWQTDNGGVFVGQLQNDGTRSGFPAALGDSQHQRIPPAAHTYRSDVETVHRLIEDEFDDLETFASRSEFRAKVTLYQHYFNLARPNSHKGALSPWQIIQQLEPRRPLHLCLLPPVFLDSYLNDQGEYDLPRHPQNSRYLSLSIRPAGYRRGSVEAGEMSLSVR